MRVQQNLHVPTIDYFKQIICHQKKTWSTKPNICSSFSQKVLVANLQIFITPLKDAVYNILSAYYQMLCSKNEIYVNCRTGFIFLAIKFSQLYFFMMQTFRDEKLRLVKVTMKNLRWQPTNQYYTKDGDKHTSQIRCFITKDAAT